MVVVPNRREARDGNVSYDEEATYREAIKTLREEHYETLNERFHTFNTKLEGVVDLFNEKAGKLAQITADAIAGARSEATIANNNLQRLLHSEIESTSKMSEASVKSTHALIDLQAKASEIAINKQNDAYNDRFEAHNKFKDQQSELIRNFVTIIVLDSKIAEVRGQVSTIERQLRIDTETARDRANALDNRITTREVAESTKRDVQTDNNLNIGSVLGIIGGIVGLLTLLYTVVAGQHPPTVGADTKRVDDLLLRLDSMQRQIIQNSDPQYRIIPPSGK